MNVDELIEVLRLFPGNMQVGIEDTEYSGFLAIGDITVHKASKMDRLSDDDKSLGNLFVGIAVRRQEWND